MAHKLCGLCFRTYVNLKQHLGGSHHIPNKEEFHLLMKFGNARTTSLLDCPVCDKVALARLDKHLHDVHSLKAADREPLLRDAKRNAIKKEFALLRSQNPPVPMVSWLDINEISDEEGQDNCTPEHQEADVDEEMAFRLNLSASSDVADETPGVPAFSSTPEKALPCKSNKGAAPSTSSSGVDSGYNVFASSSSSVSQTSSSAPKTSSSATHSSSSATHSSSSVTHSSSSVSNSSSSASNSSSAVSQSSSLVCQTSSSGVVTASSSTSQSVTQFSVRGVTSSSLEHSYSLIGQPHTDPLPSVPKMQQQDACIQVNTETQGSSKTCSCDCGKLIARLTSLEKSVNHLLQQQPSTPKTPRGVPAKVTTSAQKYEHVRKLERPDQFFQRVIDDFRLFRLGPRTASKDKENARQCASHALRFCLYMAAGLPPKTVSQDLKFVMQMDKLRSWPLYLAQKGYMPTTVRNIMTNVVLFIKHVQCSFHAQSKLRPMDFNKLIYEIKKLQSNVHKNVVVHRQKVSKKKTDEQVDVSQQYKFMNICKRKIPELLQLLSQDASYGKEHCQLMGYIMGYLSVLTGHRAVVFVNMTSEQVMAAEVWKGGAKYRILVDDHKTVGSFGQAAVCLNRTEFEWVRSVSRGQCCPNGDRVSHLIHTIVGRPVFKPALFLHMAWVNSGLTGTVSFGKIRSSVATQAKRHLSDKDRNKVAQAMCHDATTADKFYVALPDKELSYETRRLRLQAMKEALAKSKDDDMSDGSLSLGEEDPSDTPESDSDTEEPVLDDSSDSCSSLSSEEMLLMAERKKSTTAVRQGYAKEKKPKSKKQLDFCIPKTRSPVKPVVDVKCRVLLPRLPQSVADYYFRKSLARYKVLKSCASAGGVCEDTGEATQEQPGRGDLAPQILVKDTPPRPREPSYFRDFIKLEVIPETQDVADLPGSVEIEQMPFLVPAGEEETDIANMFRYVEGSEAVEEVLVQATPLATGEELFSMFDQVTDVPVGGSESVNETQIQDTPFLTGDQIMTVSYQLADAVCDSQVNDPTLPFADEVMEPTSDNIPQTMVEEIPGGEAGIPEKSLPQQGEGCAVLEPPLAQVVAETQEYT